jgi:hypothetical protein
MVTLPASATDAPGCIDRYEILVTGALIVTRPRLLPLGRVQKTLTRGTTVGVVHE